MNAADFAAMADPDRNPQFRRHWRPPDRQKRERGAGQGTPSISKQNLNHDDLQNTTADLRVQVLRRRFGFSTSMARAVAPLAWSVTP